MKDLEKAIAEYNKLYNTKKSSVEIIYCEDLTKIANCSDGDIYKAIGNALKAGYIIGYERAQKDQKKTLTKPKNEERRLAVER